MHISGDVLVYGKFVTKECIAIVRLVLLNKIDIYLRRCEKNKSGSTKKLSDFEAYCMKHILLDSELCQASEEFCDGHAIENVSNGQVSLPMMVADQFAHRIVLMYLSRKAPSAIETCGGNEEGWLKEEEYWLAKCFQRLHGVYNTVS